MATEIIDVAKAAEIVDMSETAVIAGVAETAVAVFRCGVSRRCFAAVLVSA